MRRNIAPYYIHHVGLTEVKTVDDLLSICKRLENNRYLADNFQPPTGHRRPLLEPDLACPTSKARVCTTLTPRNSKSVCWNCTRQGHLFKDCRERRNTFCYTCGKRDFTSRNCPDCGARKSK